MKKFFSMMAVLAAMFTFVACETPGDEPTDQPQKGGKLATPELTETHTPTSFTVAWDAVSGADAYIVNFKGKNTTVTECSFTVEGLNEGTYTVKVKATGANRTDSDLATIQVTITGLTEVDWFTQTLTVLTEPVEVEGQNGPYTVYPYNALEFSWQGTGVVSIAYGMYTAEQVEGKSKSEIKARLTDVSSLVQYVNAEGYAGVISGLTGSTTYKLYALVTNAEGLEFLAVSEAITAEAELAETTKAWLGNWSAKTSKVVDHEGEIVVKDQVTEFTFSITSVEGTADEVMIDGISTMGNGAPAFGQVDANGDLYIWNFASLGQVDADLYAVWYAFCETMGSYYFVSGDYPAYTLTMNEDGSVGFSRYAGELSNGEAFKVVAFDVAAINSNGELKGIYEYIWKFGDWTNIAKAEAAPAAKAVKSFNDVKPFSASVVVAM